MRNAQRILGVFFSFITIVSASFFHKVQADGVHFSVRPVLGEHQTDNRLGYFNLLLKPRQTQTLKIDLTNSSDKPIKLNASFGTAATSSSGAVDYTPDLIKPDSSLKINLKDYLQVPKHVTIEPHSLTSVTAKVTMPEQTFTGVIAGGFNFQEAESDSDTTQKSSGMTITNRYRYVIGLVLQQSMDKVAPNLTLGEVKANQRNGRNAITAHLTNTARTYLKDMNTIASVTKLDKKTVKYDFANAQVEMAPTSSFDLAIPVSHAGDYTSPSEPLEPGKYQLKMTIYGVKTPNGSYQRMVGGQVTNYQYRWEFTRDFTVTGEKASALNTTDPTVATPTDSWNELLIILLALLVLLILIIIIILLKKRRKDDDGTNPDNTTKAVSA